MKKESLVELLITYCIVKVINLITGFSYNIFDGNFNIVSLFIDLTIWLIVYEIVNLVFSKLENKEKYKSNN